MSQIKDLMKAGFLLTASLGLVGCFEDKDPETDNPDTDTPGNENPTTPPVHTGDLKPFDVSAQNMHLKKIGGRDAQHLVWNKKFSVPMETYQGKARLSQAKTNNLSEDDKADEDKYETKTQNETEYWYGAFEQLEKPEDLFIPQYSSIGNGKNAFTTVMVGADKDDEKDLNVNLNEVINQGRDADVVLMTQANNTKNLAFNLHKSATTARALALKEATIEKDNAAGDNPTLTVQSLVVDQKSIMKVEGLTISPNKDGNLNKDISKLVTKELKGTIAPISQNGQSHFWIDGQVHGTINLTENSLLSSGLAAKDALPGVDNAKAFVKTVNHEGGSLSLSRNAPKTFDNYTLSKNSPIELHLSEDDLSDSNAVFKKNDGFALYVNETFNVGSNKWTIPSIDSIQITGISDKSVGEDGTEYQVPLAWVAQASGAIDLLEKATEQYVLDSKLVTITEITKEDQAQAVIMKMKVESNTSTTALKKLVASSQAQKSFLMKQSTVNKKESQIHPSNTVAGALKRDAFANLNVVASAADMVRDVTAGSNETAFKSNAMGQYTSGALSMGGQGYRLGATYHNNGASNLMSGGKGHAQAGLSLVKDLGSVQLIAGAQAGFDNGSTEFTSGKVSSFDTNISLAKSFDGAGLSVVPVIGAGFKSSSLDSFQAHTHLKAGTLGFSMENVRFNSATLNAAVDVRLSDASASFYNMKTAFTLGVTGYLGAHGNGEMTTSEGQKASVDFDSGVSMVPYAQFNVNFGKSTALKTMMSTENVAVSFGLNY